MDKIICLHLKKVNNLRLREKKWLFTRIKPPLYNPIFLA